MKTSLVFTVALLVCLESTAIDITTQSGVTYSNVSITRTERDALIVMDKKGIYRIPASQLSHDLREKHKLTPDNRQSNVPRTVEIKGKVLQVTDDGLIIRGVSLLADDQLAARRRAGAWSGYSGSFQGRDNRYYDSGLTVFVFMAKGNYVDGSDFIMTCVPAGTHAYENVAGSTSTVKAFRAVPTK